VKSFKVLMICHSVHVEECLEPE